MHVDSGNRLVADSLEAEWNQALYALVDAKERYEKQQQSDRARLTDEQRTAVMALARLSAAGRGNRIAGFHNPNYIRGLISKEMYVPAVFFLRVECLPWHGANPPHSACEELRSLVPRAIFAVSYPHRGKRSERSSPRGAYRRATTYAPY
jgi:hypothetical protein